MGRIDTKRRLLSPVCGLLCCLLLAATALAGDGPVLMDAHYAYVGLPDIPPPITSREVYIVFDEALDLATALNVSNYKFYQTDNPSWSLDVLEAWDVGLPGHILIFLEDLPLEVNQTLEASGIRDLQGNLMAPGQFVIVEPLEDMSDLPVAETRLPVIHSIAPNPFNPAATIHFTLSAAAGQVSLGVFDLRGRLVRTLYRASNPAAGEIRVTWRGDDDAGQQVAAGGYLVRLQADGHHLVRKVMLAK
ncbi:MAG: FlgD immunoglobulin-like domain containing protein [bacterium]